jgi:hypothetical protein
MIGSRQASTLQGALTNGFFHRGGGYENDI